MTIRRAARQMCFAVLAVILPFLSLLPALAQPSRLVYPSWSDYSDLALIHWPKVLLIRESLAEGHGLPLWSPYALSGQPMAANQLAMLFYPPAWLLLIGPMTWAFSLFYALHLAWAGLGTYWLVRGLGRRPEAALLAAAIFALSGKLAAHAAVGHVSLVAAIAWTPWAFAFLHRTLVRRKASDALLTGVALAAQACTHTYALVYTAYGLALYAALYLLLEPGKLRERSRLALGAAPLLSLIPVTALLLGAAQLLPLLEMAPYSNRSLSLAEATLYSLSPSTTLTGILFPTPNVGHEWVIYPGLLTLALAAAAWRSRRERPVLIFGLLSFLGILLALGQYTPLYGLAYQILPGVRWMRTPGRLWFFVTLGLSVLAAYGLEAWLTVWRHHRRRAIRLVVVAGGASTLALSLGVMTEHGQWGRGAWGVGIFGLLTSAWSLWTIRRRPGRSFFSLALLILLADLLSFDYTLIRFVPYSEAAAAGQQAAAWLNSQPEPFRVYSPSYSLPQPAVSSAGLQQIDGVEPVHLAAYDRFMAIAGGYGEGPFSVTIPPFPDTVPIEQAHQDTTPDLRLLGLLNGRFLVTAFPMELPGLALRWQGEGTWIYENEFTLPHAFVVYQTELATDQQVWKCLDTADLAHVALVEDSSRLRNLSSPRFGDCHTAAVPVTGGDAPTPVRIIAQSPNHLTVETDLNVPGLLILSEVWYPGWTARDNGVQVPIIRADGLLRGVYLDSGSHSVEFRYSPRTVWVGLTMTGSTALLLLAWAAVRTWRRQ
jgi:hypothetical protein